MLIQFRFSNFRSYRDETELSFMSSTNLRHSEGFGVTKPEGYKKELVNIAGIFGANASGKTNVVKALRFMRDAVASSYRLWPPNGPIPLDAFRLDADTDSRPSTFQLDLIVNHIPMQYGFTLTRKEVSDEWLLAWPGGRQQRLFERTGPASFSFGRGLKGPNETIAKLTRKNSLFLSAAAQSNHQQLKPLFDWITQKILPLSPDDEKERRLFTISELEQGPKESITKLLRLADLGITDVVLEDVVLEKDSLMTPDVRSRSIRKSLELGAQPDLERDFSERTVIIRRPVFTHASGNMADGVVFEEDEESRGTLAWFALLGPILYALEQGAVLVADELDTSLHELLQVAILRLFNSPERNPWGAQIVFTCQSTTILGDALWNSGHDGESLLRRDQIWFAEKDRDGSSKLVPLTDFRVRKSENIQRWYLRGRFGAVPILDERNLPSLAGTIGPEGGQSGTACS